MATPTDVLNLCRSQIGVCENPMGSNCGTPYHAWYGSYCQGWQWCAIFVSWVIWHVDQALFYGLMTAYSGDYLNVGRMHLREIDLSQIAPGDICIWDRPVGGITDHIGFVEVVNPGARTFTTIEGNSGDCVKRNTHTEEQTSSCHYYFVRPNYSATPSPKEIEMALAITSSGPAPVRSWITTGKLGLRNGKVEMHVDNRGTAKLNLTVQVQVKSSGDFGNITRKIDASVPKLSSLDVFDLGATFKNPNAGEVEIILTGDQPFVAERWQEIT